MVSGEPSALYYGVDPDTGVEVLVTLWPDGQGDIATRTRPEHSWGPPIKMERRETR